MKREKKFIYNKLNEAENVCIAQQVNFTSIKTIVKTSHSKVRLTLAPLVDEQWWWFGVCWFDPWWEQTPFVCLVPQVLIQVSVCDLLQWLHIVHGHQVAVQVHELDTHLQAITFYLTWT